eukprot:c41959_g1_i1.p1 GENE.c41959_g1_i1~~c41959_g1_i1.p1  ORF type:complete len:186 (+),score=12.73 c41959_g1_i1:53-559(+)
MFDFVRNHARIFFITTDICASLGAFTAREKVILTVSCLAYLLPGVAWLVVGGHALVALFMVLVTTASVLADGIRVPIPGIGAVDRLVATSCALIHAYLFSKSIWAAMLIAPATGIVLWWLHMSRWVATHGLQKSDYLFYHCGWHYVSSGMMVVLILLEYSKITSLPPI